MNEGFHLDHQSGRDGGHVLEWKKNYSLDFFSKPDLSTAQTKHFTTEQPELLATLPDVDNTRRFFRGAHLLRRRPVRRILLLDSGPAGEYGVYVKAKAVRATFNRSLQTSSVCQMRQRYKQCCRHFRCGKAMALLRTSLTSHRIAVTERHRILAGATQPESPPTPPLLPGAPVLTEYSHDV